MTDVTAPVDSAFPNRMSLLMVSTSFPADLRDWRGLFIRHLTDALARRSDLSLSLWAPPGEADSRVQMVATGSERLWLDRLMKQGGIAHAYRSRGLHGLMEVGRLLFHLRHLYRRSVSTEMLHVNWLQNALPLPRGRRPLLVTVLGTDLKLLRLPLMRTMLRRVLRGRAAVICPNADWMVPVLRQAFADVAEIRFIPFGIDPRWFAVERPAFSMPARWLAVTRLTRDKVGPLFDLFEPLCRDGKRELHLIGPMQDEMQVPPWVRYHGPAGPESLQQTWFPAAAGLVSLSRHAEGRPQVMLEAMASGLPVLASDIEAHASFLHHGETGWLHRADAPLEPAILAMENLDTNRRIGSAARTWVSGAVGTWDDCAQRYVDVYRALLARSREQ